MGEFWRQIRIATFLYFGLPCGMLPASSNSSKQRQFVLFKGDYMGSAGNQNSRAFYRLRYPRQEQPTARIDGLSYSVGELSEGGMKICFPADSSLPIVGSLVGHVIFADGGTEVVEGEVLRVELKGDDHSEATLHLVKGVSLKRMISEQLRIRKKYPRLIDMAGERASEDN